MSHYFPSPDDDPLMRLYRHERTMFSQLFERMRTLANTPLSESWAVEQSRERVEMAKRRWAAALRALDSELAQ